MTPEFSDTTKIISYGYDAFGQKTFMNLPDTSGTTNPDITYVYDNVGNLISVTDSAGDYVGYGFDALGRRVSEANGLRTLSSRYDEAGRRTRLTWNDGFYVVYDYLVTGELSAIRENGSSAGASLLATFNYDYLGRRTRQTRGNGTLTTYGYDALRLTSLGQDLVDTGWDQSLGFGYNPAGQIVSRTSNNDAYSFTQSDVVNRNYTTNALNQYSQTSDGTSFNYDGRGNLKTSGSTTYTYDARNLLVSSSAGGGATFTYDAASRLRVIGSEGRVLDYDGPNLVAEYNTAGQLVRRYVHGSGLDEPIVWYEGAGTAERRWLHANHQGSVVAVSDGGGHPLAINSYDPYGMPASTNLGRFQYTGQTWMAGIGLYYYKARVYSPTLGRFMQADPIGDVDDLNLYAYVGNDPMNRNDPTGEFYFLVTGAIGFAIEGGVQVLEMAAGTRTEYEYTDMFVAGAASMAGFGLAKQLANVQRAGKIIKVVSEIGADAAVSTASTVLKGDDLSGEGVLADVLVSQAVGRGLGKLATNSAKNSHTNKVLERQADSAERVAAKSAKKAKQAKAAKARNAQEDFVENVSTRAGVAGGNAGSGIREASCSIDYIKGKPGC